MNVLIMECKQNNLINFTNALKKQGLNIVLTNFPNSQEIIDAFFDKKQFFDLCLIELCLAENGGINLLRSFRLKEEKYNLYPCKTLLVTDNLTTSKLMNFFALENDFFTNKIESEEDILDRLKDIGFL